MQKKLYIVDHVRNIDNNGKIYKYLKVSYNMENQIENQIENQDVEDSKLFTKIDPNLKDRCMVYLTESRLNRDEKINSMRDLVEAALHEYMINHPITTKS